MPKRALFLAYYVPPRQASGSARSGQLIARLPRYGWELTSLVPDLGDGTLHSSAALQVVPVRDFKAPLRRLLGVSASATTHERMGVARPMERQQQSPMQHAIRMGHDVTEYANRILGWVGPGTRAARQLLREQHFDAIISSSPPEATHLVAAQAHGQIPWIADFRDPWQREGIGKRPAALAAIDRVLEPRILRSAAALVTVSEPLAVALRKRYPKKLVCSVPNAFSAEEWDGIPFTRPPATTLLYAGQFYAGRRDPRPLFEAITQALRSGSVLEHELRVEFYGDDSEWIREEVRREGLDAIVTFHGRAPRAQILRKERSASRLLLVLSTDLAEEGTYTGKFFEYLGARRKIIAIGGPERSVIDDVLRKTGSGIRCRTIAELSAAIVEAVEEWRGEEERPLPEEAVTAYEAEALVASFAAILDSCVG